MPVIIKRTRHIRDGAGLFLCEIRVEEKKYVDLLIDSDGMGIRLRVVDAEDLITALASAILEVKETKDGRGKEEAEGRSETDGTG